VTEPAPTPAGVAKWVAGARPRTLQDSAAQVEVGTMAPIDVIQAQSQAATQRQNLAIAQGTLRTNELILKRLIVSGTQDSNWTRHRSTDRLSSRHQSTSKKRCVARWLPGQTWRRSEEPPGQQHHAEVPRTALHKRTCRFGTDWPSRAGRSSASGSGVTQTIEEIIPGGYADALSSLFDRRYPTWSVGVNVSYPIGQSSQEASYARAQLQSNQVEAQLRQIELQIATDVTNAATQVQNNIERVQAAQAAREFANRQREMNRASSRSGCPRTISSQSQRDPRPRRTTSCRRFCHRRSRSWAASADVDIREYHDSGR
jgi:hypothetical protein